MFGTIVNTIAVILGSTLGLIIHSRLPKNITTIAFQGIGLFTLVIGFSMALKTQNFLLMIFSILIGAIIGELIDISARLDTFSEFLKRKAKIRSETFSEGLVTAFLLFCMGSMTILGAIEEGMGSPPNLFFAKSVLDGFSSIALAATFGIGVMFSAVPLLIYQGALTLLAGSLETLISEPIITEISAVGGLILIGLGINILEIKEIKILNMLPALLISLVLSYFFLS
jgi:hypothetical protein